MIRKGEALPSVLFNTRVRDESIEGPNPYRWDLKSSGDYFEGKRVILFGCCPAHSRRRVPPINYQHSRNSSPSLTDWVLTRFIVSQLTTHL